jgi:adenylate kinase
MSLNLFIIGPSGCGKSTQAKLIAEKYNLTHYSTGQLLRDEIAAQSEIGLKVQELVSKGVWVPDEVVFDVLKLNLDKINDSNFIVDGFPRMLNQGLIVEDYLKSKGSSFSAVILLDVTFEEINARRQKLAANFQDAARIDNTPEAVAQKQKSYDDSVKPIIEHFKTTGQLIEVDGNRPIEPIFNDICQFIDKINN